MTSFRDTYRVLRQRHNVNMYFGKRANIYSSIIVNTPGTRHLAESPFYWKNDSDNTQQLIVAGKHINTDIFREASSKS